MSAFYEGKFLCYILCLLKILFLHCMLTSTSPLWKRVAFVANVTSKFPSALKKSIRAFQWNIFTLFLTPFSSWTLLPTQHHYQYQDNHQHLQKLPKIKKKNGVATNYACLRHWLNLCRNNKQLWGTTYCWPGLLLCVSITQYLQNIAKFDLL